MSRYNSVFTKVAGHRDWNWIAEYHSKSSLIDTVLRFRLGNFLLTRVPSQSIFKLGVGAEARTDLMNVFSFHSLLAERFTQIKLNLLSRFYEARSSFKTECTESSNINTSSCSHIFLYISAGRFHY